MHLTFDPWRLLGGADNATATLVACILLGSIIQGVSRRTLFYRREVRKKIEQLAIGTNEEYVRGLLGIPVYGSTRDGEGWLGWDLEYVHVGAEILSGRVAAFDITIMDPLFRLDCSLLTFGNISGPLGQVTYEILAAAPTGQRFDLGARRYNYCESHYYGNPGGYLNFVLSYSDSSSAGHLELHGQQAGPTSTGEYEIADESAQIESGPESTLAFLRRTGKPNTLSVLVQGISLSGRGGAGAIDHDLLRLRHCRSGLWRRIEQASVQAATFVKKCALHPLRRW